MAGLGQGLDEDETCQQLVLPALAAAGWGGRIRHEYQINDGKLLAGKRWHRREAPLRADYALEYAEDLVIAVVEAKRTRKDADEGIEQAKQYARRLDVPFAYATNGTTIYEIDATTGRIDQVDEYPSPDELWQRYRDRQGIDTDLQAELEKTPFDHQLRNTNNTPKRPRYYQRVAVNRAVRAIARGDKRLLLTLATGTGKTFVAYLIVAKLREVGWPSGRKPKILYLADRNVLVDQPKDDYFARVYGDLVHKISGGEVKLGRQIYFALYQSLENGDEQALFKQFPPDFFDLVIVDECHRGSARESSGWRSILEHYAPATQLGLTATPVRKADADTHAYFTNEIYEYSLKDGIEDGYLAPYRVRKVRLNIDMTGWRPESGQRDLHGTEIPDRLYTPRDYEKQLKILDRTDEAARYLTEYLHRTDRMGKTIVFCEDTDHAGRMMRALNNLNTDKVRQYWNYVCRITSSDGKHGQALLDAFKRIDTDEPVIAVTSRLLSTGVDMPSVRNIVLFRRISSVPEFKQIIGRGTRLCPDVHKQSFDIIDFVEATVKFNDPDFDGPPVRVIVDQEDESGLFEEVVEQEVEAPEGPADDEVAEPGSEYVEQDEGAWEAPERRDVVTDPEEIERVRAHGKGSSQMRV
ncbi:DEAD/DEAH box helicase family protein [Saccharopolyspora sp. HNM0986]|uniref:EcoAI/FtnUII family type I restriction enzme subunit R n=1 Tax=Saccharopolyspora galaxeae TaxID=2781241 RepID=UPI00190B84AA|nr:DEAD/DEAH box helicase family protein [Saccharopolyspora sp. HNM0986]MBK0865889.1 DEAD/DEAH box helicase family protein [Saccharopolyspora sp. HNM0986]